ncbi:polysaccharide deacetylase family protein [Roseivirga sp.]|uniref:polysaccharide deacetylase family protein n=1 Tax=Roseivirga sp. TaxID=1964215 RepID=UPI002B267867|nr:polysaccharide deacetylase family protein [Roseivirga sp.]
MKKALYLIFLVLFTNANAVAQAVQHEITSLVYHRFGDDRFPSTNIGTQTFEEHLKYLKAEGYSSLTISEVVDEINNSKAIKRKLVAITIDDGYKSFFENGLPLLKKYGFKATLFVNTASIGYADYMTWSEIAEAQKAGVEIGNHSHSHPFFLSVSESTRSDFFKQELQESQDLMKANLNFTPQVFAYPYGEHDEEMKIRLSEMGFKGAVAQNSGVITEYSDSFQFPRFPMSESYGDLDQFKEKMNMKGLAVDKAEATTAGNGFGLRKPKVSLEIIKNDLLIESMQCFVQGSTCAKTMEITSDGKIALSIHPETDLKRRRTLFTITIRDSKGNWHWYSYLWVIPEVQE